MAPYSVRKDSPRKEGSRFVKHDMNLDWQSLTWWDFHLLISSFLKNKAIFQAEVIVCPGALSLPQLCPDSEKHRALRGLSAPFSPSIPYSSLLFPGRQKETESESWRAKSVLAPNPFLTSYSLSLQHSDQRSFNSCSFRWLFYKAFAGRKTELQLLPAIPKSWWPKLWTPLVMKPDLHSLTLITYHSPEAKCGLTQRCPAPLKCCMIGMVSHFMVALHFPKHCGFGDIWLQG